MTYDDYISALLIWCVQLKRDATMAAEGCRLFRNREMIKVYENRISSFISGLYRLQELKTAFKMKEIESEACSIYREGCRIWRVLGKSAL
ncbi:hypothetical protein M1K46_17745 [Fictibacillus sp. WQ 8-8]|uniref:hypothetical protein n=1 Tax=Fictibacillus sp. WQ 8-8 TaxID=2938788 RepID=UPI0021097D2E|nr:hypothetical protein [Fictibacillus sp. WQ 8-8]MCQ6267480.1 hypothetical protein [Fictibacillus sp. WQ 8-8]